MTPPPPPPNFPRGVHFRQKEPSERDQGPVSISYKTSYCKISQSLEAARFMFRIVRSLWNLTGTSAGRCACQISKWCDDFNYQSRGFEISRDLTIRRLKGYWNGPNVVIKGLAYCLIFFCSHEINFTLMTSSALDSYPFVRQATGLDAWASRVKCPARFVSHLHDICIYMSCL